jgi:transaldolase
MKSTLRQLEEIGQSVWYDNISRPLLENGDLLSLIDAGVLGVTSNPTIFEKAITGGAAYDGQAREFLGAHPGAGAAPLVRSLMIRDIQAAADLFLPVYERTEGRDGYVSVEVTPGKARDTVGTIAEAAELWSQVGRPNAMIKIPATREGLPAIEETIAAGINVNVTLIFSVERYREVADAYCRGLERRRDAGKRRIASVASVFVSRIDTMVDDLLGRKIAGADPARAADLRRLLGKAAVANTKMVYQAFKEIFAGPRFARLATTGASVQRPLWASTGTKNPAYSDLLYVDALIGPHTVNTVPPATLSAIIDHSRPALTVESDLAGARAVLTDLLASGIDLPGAMNRLEEEGVASFEKSFDGLHRNLASRYSLPTG